MKHKLALIIVVFTLLAATFAFGGEDLITSDNVKFRITQLEFRTHVLEQQIDALNDIISEYEKMMEKKRK